MDESSFVSGITARKTTTKYGKKLPKFVVFLADFEGLLQPKYTRYTKIATTYHRIMSSACMVFI